MTKSSISILIIILIMTLSMVALTGCDDGVDCHEVIRIHIRANSNSEQDQQVKYVIKDMLIEYIAPLSNGINNKVEMAQLLELNMDDMTLIANKVLAENGIEYTARFNMRYEEFPARAYDEIILPQGEYQSLIIELGEGKGDNWWCVAYPPLCFIAVEDKGEEYFRYKSKLLEIFSER